MASEAPNRTEPRTRLFVFPVECPVCSWTRSDKRVSDTDLEYVLIDAIDICPHCTGKGYTGWADKCETCKGNGWIVEG